MQLTAPHHIDESECLRLDTLAVDNDTYRLFLIW
jgi:hypothetical protein